MIDLNRSSKNEKWAALLPPVNGNLRSASRRILTTDQTVCGQSTDHLVCRYFHCPDSSQTVRNSSPLRSGDGPLIIRFAYGHSPSQFVDVEPIRLSNLIVVYLLISSLTKGLVLP